MTRCRACTMLRCVACMTFEPVREDATSWHDDEVDVRPAERSTTFHQDALVVALDCPAPPRKAAR